jgi:hypothetical protein
MCCQLTVRYNDHVFDLAVINELRWGLQFFVIKPSFYATKPYWNTVVFRLARPWNTISKAFHNKYILYKTILVLQCRFAVPENLSSSEILLQMW